MEKEKKGLIEVKKEDAGKRLDKYLVEHLFLSRERIKNLIKKNHITVNDTPKKASYILHEKDIISFHIPPPKKMEILPQKGDIQVIYEDKFLAIINKPAGISVHPSPGIYENTLVNILLYKFKDLSGIGGVERPGIVHRLDKDTSGIMIVAKEEKTHLALSLAFKKREVQKTYLAVLWGNLKEKKGKIDAPIGRDPIHRKKMKITLNNAKDAITYFEVIKQFNGFTYVKAFPKTGRTHQIRVHFSYIGHPLVGDEIYSAKKKGELPIKRHALHAYSIKFTHPITQEKLEFVVDPPSDFKSLIEWLKNKRGT